MAEQYRIVEKNTQITVVSDYEIEVKDYISYQSEADIEEHLIKTAAKQITSILTLSRRNSL